MEKGIVEGCRAGVESVVLRSVLYCALLLGIIRSMNISLITAEKAEPSGGRVSHCSVCSHHAPPPHYIAMPHSSMSPAFHISLSLPFPSPPPSLTLLILSLCCSFFPTSPFVLFPYLFTLPCLHHSFACLCHCVICFLPFIAPFSLPPLFSSCSRWIETFCLLQGMLFLPY